MTTPRITYHHVATLDGQGTIAFKAVRDSAFAKLVRWIRKDPNMAAITVWSTVYGVDYTVFTPEVLRHEGRHVAQWHAYGVIGFLKKYFTEQAQHGYKGNSLEQDAIAQQTNEKEIT